jgi:L-malate glycosyltransferase
VDTLNIGNQGGASKEAHPSHKSTKVLLLVDSFELGGSEKQTVEMARRINGSEYSVTVGCFRACGPLKSVLQEASIPVVEFPIHGFTSKLYQLLRLTFFIRRKRFQVVQSNELYSNLMGVPAAWLARTAIIISSRRDLSNWWWYTPRRRKLLRHIQGLSTQIIVNCDAIRNDLVAKDSFKPDNIQVIYNGIDADHFLQVPGDRSRVIPGARKKEKLIAVVANMHMLIKGHSDLVEAARAVRSVDRRAKFILIGDGRQRSSVEQLVRETGLQDHFTFLGHRTDVPQLLSCCDMGVLASTTEGLPNAVLEYLAAGLPVVATNVGGIPEIIENEVSGLLVPPHTPSALAAAILRLLSDDLLAQRLARAGRERVLNKFSFAQVVASLKELYVRPTDARSAEKGRSNLEVETVSRQ